MRPELQAVQKYGEWRFKISEIEEKYGIVPWHPFNMPSWIEFCGERRRI
jgi:hypothetical protein